MKLLYITNGIKGAGGLERVLAVKASYLADVMKYEVHILVLNNNNAKPFYEFSPEIKLHDITVLGNPISYLNSYISGIKKIVNEIKPTIISVCDDGLKGFFLPKILNNPCPIIYERHVSKIIELGNKPSIAKRLKVFFNFKLMNYLAGSFDKFVVLTKDNLTEWNLKNLEVISNPLSFYPNEVATLNEKKVIAVGKQSFQKGFDLLLQSWKKVNENHSDWKLEIYGKFDASQKLNEIAKKLEIEKSVTFFEPVKDIQEKYLQSSIFAFSSRFEGFGMVLTEAMACGVPCVSFECPCGPSDIIKNEEDGFLIQNENTLEFANKLIFLIENDLKRKEMGKKAKENARRYLPEIIVKQWDELFKNLIS